MLVLRCPRLRGATGLVDYVKAAFNLLFLVPGQTGGLETYARYLIPAILDAAASEDEFIAFVSRDAQEWAPLRALAGRMKVITLPTHSRRREQWMFGEQVLLPRALRRSGAELMHNLTATGPVSCAVPTVTTTHDLAYHVVPDAATGVRGHVMRAIVPRVARQSRLVITGSEAARDDVVDIIGIPPERIVVIPHSAESAFAEPELTPRQSRERFALGDRLVALFPGAFRPYKNASRLLDAMRLISEDQRPVLLLTGSGAACEADLRAQVERQGLEADVRFVGWADDGLMESLYGVADVLVFPSLHEGFGLPVLEAMRRGIPVVSSGATSLPEVGGDAARYFDPYDEHAIASAIVAVIGDQVLRAEMAARGLARAEQYSWARSGTATYEVYRQALAAA